MGEKKQEKSNDGKAKSKDWREPQQRWVPQNDSKQSGKTVQTNPAKLGKQADIEQPKQSYGDIVLGQLGPFPAVFRILAIDSQVP